MISYSANPGVMDPSERDAKYYVTMVDFDRKANQRAVVRRQITISCTCLYRLDHVVNGELPQN